MSPRARETAAAFIARKESDFQKERDAGARRRFKDIGRQGFHVNFREAWTFLPQSNMAEDKVFSIERFRWEGVEGTTHFGTGSPTGAVEYRIGYWIRRPPGNWVWGQYCPLVPEEDLQPLLDKARRDGTVR